MKQGGKHLGKIMHLDHEFQGRIRSGGSGGGNVDDVYVNGSSVLDANHIAQVKTHRLLAQSAYDALTTAEKNNGIIYFVTPNSTSDFTFVTSQDQTCVVRLNNVTHERLWFWCGFLNAYGDVAPPAELVSYVPSELMLTSNYPGGGISQNGWAGFYNSNICFWNQDKSAVITGYMYGVMDLDGSSEQLNPYSDPYEVLSTDYNIYYMDVKYTRTSLSDLEDVSLLNLSDGQILKYNATTQMWENTNESGGASDLDDLSDVALSNPSNGQVLTYNSTSQEWENADPSSDVSDISDLDDVDISSPINGQTLQYNSASQKWKNVTPASSVQDLDDLSDVTISSLSDEQVLGYDSTAQTWKNVTLPTPPVTDVEVDGTSVITSGVAEINLTGKQDTLIAGNNIQIASDGKTISATDTTYSDFAGSAHGLVPPVSTQSGNFLKDDGTWSAPATAEDLNDLSDVGITTPTNGQILRYNSTSQEWENSNETAGVSDLDDLSDVSLTSLANGQVLTYNSTSQEWENSDPASIVTDLDDLGDINLSSLTDGQILQYDANSSEWINVNPAPAISELGDIPDVNISSPTNGQVLTYNSTSQEWENSNAGGGATDLDDLTDVTLSSPTDGQVLKYNSTSQQWENGTGGSDIDIVELTQEEYDELTPEEKADPTKMYCVPGNGSFFKVIDITQAEYDDLSIAEKQNPQNLYLIDDEVEYSSAVMVHAHETSDQFSTIISDIDALTMWDLLENGHMVVLETTLMGQGDKLFYFYPSCRYINSTDNSKRVVFSKFDTSDIASNNGNQQSYVFVASYDSNTQAWADDEYNGTSLLTEHTAINYIDVNNAAVSLATTIKDLQDRVTTLEGN